MPDFDCVDEGLNPVKLADTAGKVRLFSVVPSLDTPVCNTQTKKFAHQLNALGDKVAAYTISLDLPFAMKRFCSENIHNLINLSDAHNHSFGEHYGVLIANLPIPLLARAVFVLDPGHPPARRVHPRDRHGARLQRRPRRPQERRRLRRPRLSGDGKTARHGHGVVAMPGLRPSSANPHRRESRESTEKPLRRFGARHMLEINRLSWDFAARTTWPARWRG